MAAIRHLAGAAVAGALLAAVACSSPAPSASSGTTGAGGSCAALLVYQGREYLGAGSARHLPIGRALGPATQPPCYDNVVDGTPRGEPAQQIDVNAMAGVDPRWAIYDGRQNLVYVARQRPSGSMPPALQAALRH